AVEAHDVRLVVVGPVADIFAAFRRQEVEGVPGLLQARAQPADRPPTGGVRDRRQRARDDRLFLARRRFVEAARIAFAMTHPLPPALSARSDDLGMVGAEIAVERDGAAHAVAVEHLHEAEHAHAVAVVARRPRRDIGHRRAGTAGTGRPLLPERKALHIWNDQKLHRGAIGPGQARAPHDVRIGKRAVRGGLHLRPCAPAQLAFLTARPSRWAATSSMCITSTYLWCMSNRLTLWDRMQRSKQHSSTSTT